MKLSPEKRLSDPEFRGWKSMHSIREGLWIYFSPDNVNAALVDITVNRVLLVMHRPSRSITYEDGQNLKKSAKRSYMRHIT